MSIANLLVENLNIVHANDLVSDKLDTYTAIPLDLGTVTASRVNIGTITHQIPFYINGVLYNAGGVTALANIGSSPNANGATLVSNTLTLQPASAAYGGVVTVADQVFTGIKTYNLGVIVTPTVTLGLSNTFNNFAYAPATSYTFTGIGFDIILNISFQRNQNFVNIGFNNSNYHGAGSTIAILTSTTACPVEFRPTTGTRTSILPVLDADLFRIGAFSVDTSGIIRMGVGMTLDSALINFTGGTLQILTSGANYCLL